MEFEWDDKKNDLNWAKHRVDFADAIYVFLDENRVEREDTRKNYGETRYQTIGYTEKGVLFVVFTERSGDIIRIISARKVSKREQKYYENGNFKPYPQGVRNGN